MAATEKGSAVEEATIPAASWPADALLHIAERARNILELEDENHRLTLVIAALVESRGGEAVVGRQTMEYLDKFHELVETHDGDFTTYRLRFRE